jgi:hypothetical protein
MNRRYDRAFTHQFLVVSIVLYIYYQNRRGFPTVLLLSIERFYIQKEKENKGCQKQPYRLQVN